MNHKQLVALVGSVALFLLLELFPPWRYEYAYGASAQAPSGQHRCPAGYSFVSHPPPVRPYGKMLALCNDSEIPASDKIAIRLETWRLNWQRGILALLAAGLSLVLSQPLTRSKQLLGRSFLALGFVVLGLYVVNVWAAYL